MMNRAVLSSRILLTVSRQDLSGPTILTVWRDCAVEIGFRRRNCKHLSKPTKLHVNIDRVYFYVNHTSIKLKTKILKLGKWR
jgi:hypothetical protein